MLRALKLSMIEVYLLYDMIVKCARIAVAEGIQDATTRRI